MSLLSGIWQYLIGGLFALAGLIGLYLKIEQGGVNKEKAKEAKRRAENLDRIKNAAAARPVGGVSDDPNNRD